MEETTWSLGAVRRDDQERRDSRLVEARELTKEQFDGLASDVSFLRNLGGHSLIAGLVDKLNAVVQIEGELYDRPHIYRDARFGYRLASEIDAFLAEITAFRHRIETLVRRYMPSYELRITSLFKQIHDDNANYRLAWELRNLSQHGVGASHYFHLTDTDEGKLWAINLPHLFADHVGEKRWEGAGALFGAAEDTRVVEVLHGAYSSSSKVMAIMLVENEMEIAAVVDRVTQAMAVGVENTRGFPVAWSLAKTSDSTVHINELPLEPLVIGYAIGSLHGARSILGLPPSTRFPSASAGNEKPAES
ncbi:hypothetical protein [Mycetocola zhujimingii]|nr:hypothetical protein [Mycetocola zhujimingii]